MGKIKYLQEFVGFQNILSNAYIISLLCSFCIMTILRLSLSDIASAFDSVYISFYKGLGSITGAMILGNKEFCDEARVWLTRFGGNLYTLLPFAVDCWSGFDTYAAGSKIDNFKKRYNKLQEIVGSLRSITNFDKFVVFDPPLPETNMIHVYLKASIEDCETARDIVLHDTGVSVFNRIREIPEIDSSRKLGFGAYFEWTIGTMNCSIDNEVILNSWKIFLEVLQSVKGNAKSEEETT